MKEEIPITFVGLRHEEKLYEELVGRDETVEPSGVEKILRVRPGWMPEPADLARKVAELERLAALGEFKAVIEQLCEVVPTFHPMGMWGSGGNGDGFLDSEREERWPRRRFWWGSTITRAAGAT